MIKNTAGQKVGAQLVSATDGSAFTGSVTVAVTVDAGTQATGSVGSGACAHEGNGYHTYAPSQAETNGDLVAFTFTGTGAVPATVQVYTRTGDAFARLGTPAGASVSADIATVAGYIDTEVAAIKAKTDNLPSDPADASDIAASFATVSSTLSTISGYLDTEIAAILEDTGTTIPAQIAALNDLSAAEVNAEVLDVLATDTFAEPASVPAATSSLKDKINWLFALARNKISQTATTQSLKADDGTSDIATATVSDDGTTLNRNEWV